MVWWCRNRQLPSIPVFNTINNLMCLDCINMNSNCFNTQQDVTVHAHLPCLVWLTREIKVHCSKKLSTRNSRQQMSWRAFHWKFQKNCQPPIPHPIKLSSGGTLSEAVTRLKYFFCKSVKVTVICHILHFQETLPTSNAISYNRMFSSGKETR